MLLNIPVEISNSLFVELIECNLIQFRGIGIGLSIFNLKKFCHVINIANLIERNFALFDINSKKWEYTTLVCNSILLTECIGEIVTISLRTYNEKIINADGTRIIFHSYKNKYASSEFT